MAGNKSYVNKLKKQESKNIEEQKARLEEQKQAEQLKQQELEKQNKKPGLFSGRNKEEKVENNVVENKKEVIKEEKPKNTEETDEEQKSSFFNTVKDKVSSGAKVVKDKVSAGFDVVKDKIADGIDAVRDKFSKSLIEELEDYDNMLKNQDAWKEKAIDSTDAYNRYFIKNKELEEIEALQKHLNLWDEKTYQDKLKEAETEKEKAFKDLLDINIEKKSEAFKRANEDSLKFLKEKYFTTEIKTAQEYKDLIKEIYDTKQDKNAEINDEDFKDRDIKPFDQYRIKKASEVLKLNDFVNSTFDTPEYKDKSVLLNVAAKDVAMSETVKATQEFQQQISNEVELRAIKLQKQVEFTEKITALKTKVKASAGKVKTGAVNVYKKATAHVLKVKEKIDSVIDKQFVHPEMKDYLEVASRGPQEQKNGFFNRRVGRIFKPNSKEKVVNEETVRQNERELSREELKGLADLSTLEERYVKEKFKNPNFAFNENNLSENFEKYVTNPLSEEELREEEERIQKQTDNFVRENELGILAQKQKENNKDENKHFEDKVEEVTQSPKLAKVQNVKNAMSYYSEKAEKLGNTVEDDLKRAKNKEDYEKLTREFAKKIEDEIKADEFGSHLSYDSKENSKYMDLSKNNDLKKAIDANKIEPYINKPRSENSINAEVMAFVADLRDNKQIDKIVKFRPKDDNALNSKRNFWLKLIEVNAQLDDLPDEIETDVKKVLDRISYSEQYLNDDSRAESQKDIIYRAYEMQTVALNKMQEAFKLSDEARKEAIKEALELTDLDKVSDDDYWFNLVKEKDVVKEIKEELFNQNNDENQDELEQEYEEEIIENSYIEKSNILVGDNEANNFKEQEADQQGNLQDNYFKNQYIIKCNKFADNFEKYVISYKNNSDYDKWDDQAKLAYDEMVEAKVIELAEEMNINLNADATEEWCKTFDAKLERIKNDVNKDNNLNQFANVMKQKDVAAELEESLNSNKITEEQFKLFSEAARYYDVDYTDIAKDGKQEPKLAIKEELLLKSEKTGKLAEGDYGYTIDYEKAKRKELEVQAQKTTAKDAQKIADEIIKQQEKLEQERQEEEERKLQEQKQKELEASAKKAAKTYKFAPIYSSPKGALKAFERLAKAFAVTEPVVDFNKQNIKEEESKDKFESNVEVGDNGLNNAKDINPKQKQVIAEQIKETTEQKNNINYNNVVEHNVVEQTEKLQEETKKSYESPKFERIEEDVVYTNFYNGLEEYIKVLKEQYKTETDIVKQKEIYDQISKMKIVSKFAGAAVDHSDENDCQYAREIIANKYADKLYDVLVSKSASNDAQLENTGKSR